MDNKQNVPLDESSVHIVGRHQALLRGIILDRFQCEATFEGVDFQGDSNTYKKRKAPSPPVLRYRTVLPSGVQVSVWKADLTELKVDAVVNPANEQLSHGGGLAAALSKAGGPRIKRDSNDYIHRKGLLNTGDAIICDAGSLPCKKLIHAVGPYLAYNSQVTQARPQLAKAIRSILDIVGKHGLNTVAIPAISSGLFNYPLIDCADTIVSTVRRYFDSLSKSQLKSFHNPNPVEIQLVNNDEPTVAEMVRACRQTLGPPSSMSYSKAVSSNTRSATNTPPITVQIGNIHVMLKKDNIEEQQTDVIVNTASPNRDLSIGMISKALLTKAGHKMQQEIKHAQKRGSIVVTKPHNLDCKEVFHTFCVEKSRRDAEQILSSSVWDCLLMAEKRQYRSVAFPAIGTGNLGFSRKEVASIMSAAVADFAKHCKIRLDVHFVIFPSDIDTFEAFEEEIKSLKSKQPTLSVPLDDSRSKKSGTPHISLMSPSTESIREAKKWLTELLRPSDQVIIQNNFIQHFSDQEYRQLAYFHRDGVSVEEFLSSGHACINLSSESHENVAEATLQVEGMLQEVQRTFLNEEVREMKMVTQSEVSGQRNIVDDTSSELLDVVRPFHKLPLSPVKVEKVINMALDELFTLKKQQLQCFSTRKMYQCIPAQFCDMICQIGFHVEIAPPEAPDFGEGIYFAATVEKARELWKGSKEEYLYFVEAEVLEGSSTSGKPGLIFPPVTGKDGQMLFSSVHGGPDITVIFSGHQALPRYIITCGK